MFVETYQVSQHYPTYQMAKSMAKRAMVNMTDDIKSGIVVVIGVVELDTGIEYTPVFVLNQSSKVVEKGLQALGFAVRVN